MNKASGGDGIPLELFQILKDEAVKLLHSICHQIWKTQQWPQDWKRAVFIPIPKKGNVKECSNYRTIALISHASKVVLKILQARFHPLQCAKLLQSCPALWSLPGSSVHGILQARILEWVAISFSNYRTIALISHASKVLLKIFQARLQQYMKQEFPQVQVGF